MPPETNDTKATPANTNKSNDPAQLLDGKDGTVNFTTNLLNGSLTGEAGQSSPGNYFGNFVGKNNANGNTVFGDLQLSTDPTFKLNEYHLGTQFGIGSNGKATLEVTGTPPEDKLRIDAKVVDPNGGQVAGGATIEGGNLTQADILLQRDDNSLSIKNQPGRENLTTADLTAVDAKKNTYTANGTFDNQGTQNLGVGATISDPNGKTIYDASVQPVNNTGTIGVNRVGTNEDTYNVRANFSPSETTYKIDTNTNLPITGGTRNIVTDTTLAQPSNGDLTANTRATVTDTRGENTTVTTVGVSSEKADIGITTRSVYPNKDQTGNPATLDTIFTLDTTGNGTAGFDHSGANGSQHKADIGLANGVVNFSGSTSDPASVFNTPGVVKTSVTAGGEVAATGSVSFDSTPQTLQSTQSGVTAFGASAGFDAAGVNASAYVNGQVAIDPNTLATYQADVKVTPQSTVASGEIGLNAVRGSTTYTANVKANTEVGFQEANLGITTGSNFTATAYAKPGDVGAKFEYKSDADPLKPFDAQASAKQITDGANEFRDKQTIALLSPQDKKLYDQAVVGVERLNAQGAGLNVEKTALFAVANVPSDNGKRAEKIELDIGNPAKGGQTLIVGNGNLRDPATEKTAFNPQTASNAPIADSANTIRQQNTLTAVQELSAPTPSLDNPKRAAP
jgi:hypothetical protein